MKTRKLIISQEAADEIELSYHYYESQSPGLGERFRKKLVETFSSILHDPEMFSIAEDDFRVAVMRIFPFVVVFEIVNGEIRIYSVFHTSRNPRKKFRKK